VQTITSSVDFVTGSTRFGSILENTHVFSGSVTMNPNGLFVSGSGLVGIGNVVPAYTLDVSGTGRFTGALTSAGLTSTGTISLTPSSFSVGSSTATDANSLTTQAANSNYLIRFKNAAGTSLGGHYYDGTNFIADGPSWKFVNNVAIGSLQSGGQGSISGASGTINRAIVNCPYPGASALTLGYYSAGYGLDIWVNGDGTGLAPVYIDQRQNEAIIFRRSTYSSASETMRIASGGQVIAPYGYQSFKGSVSIAAGGTAVIYTMSTDGVYYVYCRLNGGAQYYLASAIVTGLPSGGTSQISNTYNGSNVNINLSGNDIRITSGAYSTYTWQWSILYQPVD
jgi:hypothetical protein